MPHRQVVAASTKVQVAWFWNLHLKTLLQKCHSLLNLPKERKQNYLFIGKNNPQVSTYDNFLHGQNRRKISIWTLSEGDSFSFSSIYWVPIYTDTEMDNIRHCRLKRTCIVASNKQMNKSVPNISYSNGLWKKIKYVKGDREGLRWGSAVTLCGKGSQWGLLWHAVFWADNEGRRVSQMEMCWGCVQGVRRASAKALR